MSTYRPPLDDIGFTLEEITDLEHLAKLPAFVHADPDSVRGALEECGRFVAEVVAPLNHLGDRQHSRRHDDGRVTTPAGFAAAYQQYVAAGWPGVPLPVEHGGGGFPWLAGIAVEELLAAANLAFSLCPLLTQSAVELLAAHGSEEQRATWLPQMVSGEWTGTMCLTEPDAGSDVGAVRTRAVPASDGSWRITGQKIFITYGEHDLAENIVHLVLARVPGAPPGSGGISCFLVPKVLGADRGPGERNAVTCVSIETKLGINASPTCVLDFDGAVGYLVGEPNGGLRCMFTMMNKARLSVAVQGLAISERAYQQAVDYARERRQGRAVGGDGGPAAIIEHPDVRRMLLTMRASIEALRALVYLVAESVDLADADPDAAVRAERRELVELLTPVAKAWGTDLGVELTSLALQVHGGMGYVEETGAAQHFRDARIGPIYEGTNGIQALDLVTRKLPMDGGRVVLSFLDRIDALDTALTVAGDELDSIRATLALSGKLLRTATDRLLAARSVDPATALAAATPYLQMVGIVTGGWLMARQALAAHRRLGAGDERREFLGTKVATARFYCEQILPQTAGLLPAVTASPHHWLALDTAHL